MAEADRLLETHGIGKAQAPANPAAADLFRSFCERAETAPKALEVENRFFAGYGKSELDWSRPVHGILGDFKGDSMQMMGMLLQRLEACKEQYIFLGNPPPFNGGWHFTALDDFEHPTQKDLDPSWRNIRIWHKVNYVASQTEKGEVALVPKEEFDPKNKHQGAIAISSTFKLATIFLTGGLMPHTLNATLLADGSDAAALLLKHLELKTRVAAIGHGLDVLLALGALKGFEAAHFPNQEHLLRINGLQPSGSPVCACAREGLELVTAGFWGQATAEPFFAALGLGSAAAEPRAADVGRAVRVRSAETAFCWDAGKLQQLKGTCITGDPAAPTVAVLVDDVADPIEAYTMIDHLIQLKFNAHLISHSQDERRARNPSAG
ncbi:unnamed protein product [Effrenium voratum]|uniref:Uncharacterized protein n=1 Tax=Effrenium voratum TaxID=2562239 RepID=A0AA36MIU8_9DINO|nr:unnamed protein product [Effrenium voratum]